MSSVLDKLKIAGYVTSTDPSDAIEEALDIQDGGSSDFPEAILESTDGMLSAIDYDAEEFNGELKVNSKFAVKDNNKIVTMTGDYILNVLSNIDVNSLGTPIAEFHNTKALNTDDSFNHVNVYDLPSELQPLSKLIIYPTEADVLFCAATYAVVRFNFKDETGTKQRIYSLDRIHSDFLKNIDNSAIIGFDVTNYDGTDLYNSLFLLSHDDFMGHMCSDTGFANGVPHLMIYYDEQGYVSIKMGVAYSESPQ